MIWRRRYSIPISALGSTDTPLRVSIGGAGEMSDRIPHIEGKDEDEPSIAGSDVNVASDVRARKSVLIIEDEPGLAEIIAINLQASGYDPTVAHDGLQALYHLDRATPDVILLDLQLPQVSGFRLIQLLRGRESTATVPVIVMTALSFREAEDVVRAGADGFLTKPFAPEEVVARVDHLFALRMQKSEG
ncbi:MAG: response regulator [Proteobacteria bacterium]|jgi:CheY-like chemotaxis protein|nr:response regulator [Pseudomonadota bacterium]